MARLILHLEFNKKKKSTTYRNSAGDDSVVDGLKGVISTCGICELDEAITSWSSVSKNDEYEWRVKRDWITHRDTEKQRTQKHGSRCA